MTEVGDGKFRGTFVQSVHGGVDFSSAFRIDVCIVNNCGTPGTDLLTILVDGDDHDLTV